MLLWPGHKQVSFIFLLFLFYIITQYQQNSIGAYVSKMQIQVCMTVCGSLAACKIYRYSPLFYLVYYAFVHFLIILYVGALDRQCTWILLYTPIQWQRSIQKCGNGISSVIAEFFYQIIVRHWPFMDFYNVQPQTNFIFYLYNIMENSVDLNAWNLELSVSSTNLDLQERK